MCFNIKGKVQIDQVCLELFRFLHNVCTFLCGKKEGFCPVQQVGFDFGAPLSLLSLSPIVSS